MNTREKHVNRSYGFKEATTETFILYYIKEKGYIYLMYYSN